MVNDSRSLRKAKECVCEPEAIKVEPADGYTYSSKGQIVPFIEYPLTPAPVLGPVIVSPGLEKTLGGRKDDAGKARFDLIPPEALEALASLYALGASRYGDHNWRKGMLWSRPFAALMRHAWAWWRGEKFDPKDGQHHLQSVAWNAFSLYMYELKQLGEDDRVK